MSWTRTPAEMPDEAANDMPSDAAYRTHHEALTWISRVERTDCHIPAEMLRRFTGSPHYQAAVEELVATGWWQLDRQGYRIVKHADVTAQSITAQQKARSSSKASSARYRAKKAAEQDAEQVHGDTSRDVSRTYLPNYLPTNPALEDERVTHNGGALEDEPPW